MKRIIGLIFFLPAVFSSLNCNPTYAPPIRSQHLISPGRIEKGNLEADGYVDAFVLSRGGASLAIAPSDWYRLELGADIVPGLFVMGNAGARLAP